MWKCTELDILFVRVIYSVISNLTYPFIVLKQFLACPKSKQNRSHKSPPCIQSLSLKPGRTHVDAENVSRSVVETTEHLQMFFASAGGRTHISNHGGFLYFKCRSNSHMTGYNFHFITLEINKWNFDSSKVPIIIISSQCGPFFGINMFSVCQGE
jgi:hypothetical protein